MTTTEAVLPAAPVLEEGRPAPAFAPPVALDVPDPPVLPAAPPPWPQGIYRIDPEA